MSSLQLPIDDLPPARNGGPVALDYIDLARQLPRNQFAVNYPCPFLFGSGFLISEPGQRSTQTPLVYDDATRGLATVSSQQGQQLLLLAVRKVQETFESMITVGRTANHDIVVRDASVSRFHAFFRLRTGCIEVTDVGSSNGTWIGSRYVRPKGNSCVVDFGETIRFGKVAFTVLDAARSWDRLRSL